jgi:hypothetical protein
MKLQISIVHEILCAMDSTAASPEAKAITIPPMELFKVLGNPLRWEIMLLFADGRTMSATDAAPALKRPFDVVLKHLRILRDAGLLICQTSSQDARFLLYYMPEQWRPRPGVFDFGWCVMTPPPRRM